METAKHGDEPGIEVRFLEPEGAEGFTRLVRRCYGDSYDAAWVYDPARWPTGCGAAPSGRPSGVADDGELVAHVGLARQRPTTTSPSRGRPSSTPSTAGATSSRC